MTDDWTAACTHLQRADAVMARLIAAHPGDELRGSGDGFRTLLNAIVGQQISVAAAEAIWTRLQGAVVPLEPPAVASADPATLRAVGLSARKVAYVRGIAHAFTAGAVAPARWPMMTDNEISAELTALHGVGPWTAQMVLIFFLRRLDVLPLGDIGLVNAATRLYGWETAAPTLRDRQKLLSDHAERWRPYRTVATWYIWRDLDAEPVIY